MEWRCLCSFETSFLFLPSPFSLPPPPSSSSCFLLSLLFSANLISNARSHVGDKNGSRYLRDDVYGQFVRARAHIQTWCLRDRHGWLRYARPDFPPGTFAWNLLRPPSPGYCKRQTFYGDCPGLCRLLGVGSDPSGSSVPPRAWCLYSRDRGCKWTVLEPAGCVVALELLLLWRRSFSTRRGGSSTPTEAETVDSPGCLQVLTAFEIWAPSCPSYTFSFIVCFLGTLNTKIRFSISLFLPLLSPTPPLLLSLPSSSS